MTLNVKQVEDLRNAKYVGCYDYVNREGPFYTFYRKELSPEEESKGFDNYFAYFKSGATGNWYITSGRAVRETVWAARQMPDGSFICSRTVHNYVTGPDGSFLDGGPFYTRYNPDKPPTHTMRIVDGEEVFEPR